MLRCKVLIVHFSFIYGSSNCHEFITLRIVIECSLLYLETFSVHVSIFSSSADEYTINSGDNSLTRCMSSVLLMTKKFVMSVSQVSFEYRVDSRNCRGPGYLGCDGLAFFVDNKELLTYSGNKFNWVNVTYSLTKVCNLEMTWKW